MKLTAEADLRRSSRRSAQRSIGAAEGILVALRHCTLDEAFIDIVQTAKQHSVAPLGLAGALVAIAENDSLRDFDDAVIAAAHQAWGALLGVGPGCGDERQHAQQPPMIGLQS